MSEKIGSRWLNKKAFEIAASLIENEDFCSFFGDDIEEKLSAQKDGDDLMHKAMDNVVTQLRAKGLKP